MLNFMRESKFRKKEPIINFKLSMLLIKNGKSMNKRQLNSI